jgi:hypothetical protein
MSRKFSLRIVIQNIASRLNYPDTASDRAVKFIWHKFTSQSRCKYLNKIKELCVFRLKTPIKLRRKIFLEV